MPRGKKKATADRVAKASAKVTKKVMASAPPKGKRRYLARADRVETLKLDGWKVVGVNQDKKQIGLEELVLMEK